jgi:uncharacterized membrane protein
MGKKLALNVLYTIGIFLCAATIMWAWPLKRYEFIFGALLVAILFIVLKVKLLKELRTPPSK